MRAMLLALGLSAMTSLAWAQSDYGPQLCAQGYGSERIAACTRLIHSRQLPLLYQSRAYASRGTEYAKLGALDQALADLTTALQIEPNLTDAYYNRGKIYLDMSQFDHAINDFNAAIQLNPNDTWNYHERGVAYARQGRFEDAWRDLETALTLDPTNQTARRNLNILNSFSEQATEQSDTEEQRLKVAKAIAIEMCQIPTTGSKSSTEIYGEVGGTLGFVAGIMRIVMPELFAKIGSKYNSAEWQGPAQEDMAEIVISGHNCRLAIMNRFF